MKVLWISIIMFQVLVACELVCPPILAAKEDDGKVSHQPLKRAGMVVTKDEFVRILNHNFPKHERFYPTEVVGHHGYSSEYLFQFVLGQRLQIEVASHDKQAMHIVPLDKNGLGGTIYRMMNNIAYREHGILVAVVKKSDLKEVRVFLPRVDFAIVLEEGESSADLFSDLIVEAAKSQAIEKDVYVYAEEGNRATLQTLLHIAAKSYYQLNNDSNNIQIVADTNFNPTDVVSTSGQAAATALASLHKSLAQISDHLQITYTYHRESGAGAQFLSKSAPIRQSLADVDAGDQRIRDRVRKYSNGLLHLQNEVFFDLKGGQYLVINWVDDGVLGVHVVFPPEDEQEMENGRFNLEISIDGHRIPRTAFTEGQIIELDYGQKAVYFELEGENLNISSDPMKPVPMAIHYSYSLKTDLRLRGALYRQLGQGFVAAAESHLMLLEAQLNAARRELARLEEMKSGDDVENRIYQERWKFTSYDQAYEYLSKTVATLSVEIDEKKDSAMNNIARTLNLDLGFNACGTAFIPHAS